MSVQPSMQDHRQAAHHRNRCSWSRPRWRDSCPHVGRGRGTCPGADCLEAALGRAALGRLLGLRLRLVAGVLQVVVDADDVDPGGPALVRGGAGGPGTRGLALVGGLVLLVLGGEEGGHHPLVHLLLDLLGVALVGEGDGLGPRLGVLPDVPEEAEPRELGLGRRGLLRVVLPNIVLQDARKNHKAFTEPITLKVGAPIVLTGNVDPRRGLVNNTHGRVAGFIYDNQGALSAITATFGDRTHNISRLHRILGGPDPTTGRRGHTHTWHVNHFPVAATFALTCHRAQGETITNDMYVSLNDLWESGQVYVTLSRCAEGKHLHILDFDRRLILASINKTAISPRVLRALAYLKERPAFTSLAIWEIHEKTPMPYLPSGGAVHPPRLQFRSGL